MTELAENRPDTAAILSQLKDFQRHTVEYVFRRLYVDPDFVRRFLIADEVGLGKTLVARGLIAKAIDHLWERTKRIDIVYVCSNADIARQNISRLNVTGRDDFSLASRITLLPIHVSNMQHRRLNFVSFTPGTSFDLKDSAGWALERQLLYWLLQRAWTVSFNPATRVLQGASEIDGFRDRVRAFPGYYTIHPEIAEEFSKILVAKSNLRGKFEELCARMPRAGATVPDQLRRESRLFIGEMRKLLAQTCLGWLEPDVIILDEFQRFKHLLQCDDENASDASQLARHLFNYQESQSDPSLAARVLLLSATPYKMYTLHHEKEQDDHHADFHNTLGFLLPDPCQRIELRNDLRDYRQQLFRIADGSHFDLRAVKHRLEQSLRKVMVRTERLALTSDRNGMLTEVMPEKLTLEPADLQQYLSLQRISKLVDADDILEYWKSAPYLLNLMEDYKLKRKFVALIDAPGQPPELSQSMLAGREGLLHRRRIECYRQIDPGNARLRYLARDTIERQAWQLLWVPPSLPYYRGDGPFADPALASFTKRLVFSNWKVVPKAIATVLSYEAERRMIQTFRRKAQNTTESRKKRRPLLRFTFREGRPTGMAVLGLIYPCRTLADRFDPLQFASRDGDAPEQTLDSLVSDLASQVEALVAPLIERFVDPSHSTPDENWYWAAPLLLDWQHDQIRLIDWLEQDDLAEQWADGASFDDARSASGWSRHVEIAREFIQRAGSSRPLGRPPDDLFQTLARVAVAAPGVVALRSLNRLSTMDRDAIECDLRPIAAPLAHAFLHLFNLPEVTYLLRDPQKTVPYWESALRYCASGNLQAVLDEYTHILVESLGLVGRPVGQIATEITDHVRACLMMRTSTAQVDLYSAGKRRVRRDEPYRFRTRFAMRFGDQDSEDGSEPTRADHVRSAFNSPFWPFVLATTSVGQEGLDFHSYCHAVVHWNLPSNPVDLEQREGRVHRYKGHAVRKNVAARFGASALNGGVAPWQELFRIATQSSTVGQNDLFPFWITSEGPSRIERHVPALPLSRDTRNQEDLRRALVVYRMAFGQNRQEDVMRNLLHGLPSDEIARLLDVCRIDLSPPSKECTTEIAPSTNKR